MLQFEVAANAATVRIPSGTTKVQRADNLWESTCFEGFARRKGSDEYVELNFAPSMAWNAYHFRSYRQGMSRAACGVPGINVTLAPSVLGLSAWLDATDGGLLSNQDTWQIALSAVIEETDGTKSYWALRHPPGPPDFHHPDCFALELAAPDRT